MSGNENDPDGDSGSRREAAGADPPRQAGVLGNLPKQRPSVRSPRRKQAKPAAVASEKRPPEAAPKTPPRPPEPQVGAGSEHSAAADLENFARGGIAIAGGAASLGLKMAGRAAAALRDAVERR